MNESRDVLEYRIASLELAVNEIRQAVKSIDASLQVLARLEVHHADTRDTLARAFSDIGDHETRMRLIEEDMPTVKLTSRWVTAGVIGIVAMVGVTLLQMLKLT